MDALTPFAKKSKMYSWSPVFHCVYTGSTPAPVKKIQGPNTCCPSFSTFQTIKFTVSTVHGMLLGGHVGFKSSRYWGWIPSHGPNFPHVQRFPHLKANHKESHWLTSLRFSLASADLGWDDENCSNILNERKKEKIPLTESIHLKVTPIIKVGDLPR